MNTGRPRANPVVGYRRLRGPRFLYGDNEIICVPCHDKHKHAEDSSIVWHSENGARILRGSVRCSDCTSVLNTEHLRNSDRDDVRDNAN